MDALVELVAQTMACGVMWFADNRDRIQLEIAMDSQAHLKPFYHQFMGEARDFLDMRSDLVEALTEGEA